MATSGGAGVICADKAEQHGLELPLLAAYGIPAPAEEVVATAEEAAVAATRIGFPVVVKVVSPDILHKTEVEGIRLNLRDAEAVRDAAAAVLAAERQFAAWPGVSRKASGRLRPPLRAWILVVRPP